MQSSFYLKRWKEALEEAVDASGNNRQSREMVEG
jgi:hypothetical protein